MKKTIIFLSFILLLLSFLGYQINEILQPFKQMTSTGKEKCRLLSNVPEKFQGPEDMVKYEDFIIISATYHTKLYEKKNFIISKISGGLYLLYPNETLQNLVLNGFPSKDIDYFRPFSLSLHENYLYVLNEYYELGNDRIEVFQINKIKNQSIALQFLYSITFEDNFLGMFNNFFLLDKNEFLITTWQPNPDPKTGRANDPRFFSAVKKYYNLLSGQKKTHVYYCVYQGSENTSCIKIKNTEGIMNNGILFDKPNKLVYVAKTVERKVSIFHLKEENHPDNLLVHYQDLELPCSPDNLNYDSEKQRIIIGCTGRGIDYFRLIKTVNADENGELQKNLELWFGLVSIEKDKKINVLFMDDKMYWGVAGGIRRGKNMYIGSFCEKSLLVCEF